jgi:hypothetical protein
MNKFDELRTLLWGHRCEDKLIIPNDRPPDRVGWLCMGCEKGWIMSLHDLRQTPMDSPYRKMFQSAEGRMALVRHFNNEGVVFIWDEQEI